MFRQEKSWQQDVDAQERVARQRNAIGAQFGKVAVAAERIERIVGSG